MMQKLELIDETFDRDRTESYELSIQLSLNGFSFCVKDNVRNCFIVLVAEQFPEVVSHEEWSKPLKGIIDSYSWLKNTFKKIVFTYESNVFTIVPNDFFDPEKSKSLLELIHPIPDLFEVRYNSYPNSITTIFAQPSYLTGEWLKIQPKTNFVAYCEPIHAFHLVKNLSPKSISLTIHFNSTFAAVVVSKGQQLNHCTTFCYRTNTDSVFHMMNICKSLEIKPDEVFVNAVGTIEDLEQLQALVKRFFKDFSAAPEIDQNSYSYLLSKHKVKYANLFNMSLCGL